MTTPVQNYVKALGVPGQASANGVNTGTQKTTESKAKIGNMLTNPEALTPDQGQMDAMKIMLNAKKSVLAIKEISRYELTQQINALDFDLANDKILPPEQKTALKAQRATLMKDLAKVESEIKTIENEIAAIEQNVVKYENTAKNPKMGLNMET